MYHHENYDPKLMKGIKGYPEVSILEGLITRQDAIRYVGGRTRSSLSQSLVPLIQHDEQHPTIFSRAAYLHELIELECFRRAGVLENILGGQSNREYYDEADEEAVNGEMEFYNSMAQLYLGRKLPPIAFGLAMFSQPFSGNDWKKLEMKQPSELREQPFTMEDVRGAIELFYAGGCNTAQAYRSVRVARFILEKMKIGTMPIDKFTLAGRPSENLAAEELSSPFSLDNKNLIYAYGIQHADMDNETYSGWVEVGQDNDEFKFRRIVPWVSTANGDFIRRDYRTILPHSLFSHPSEKPSLLAAFLDYCIDSYCGRKLGLAMPQQLTPFKGVSIMGVGEGKDRFNMEI